VARQTLADYDCSKDHPNVVEYQMGEVDGLPFRPLSGTSSNSCLEMMRPQLRRWRILGLPG